MAVVVGPQAYIKIVLHAAKYPHCSVNGVLLADLRKKDGRSVVIVDAVPFFHQALALAPMLEVALTQVCLVLIPFLFSTTSLINLDLLFIFH